MAREIVLDTETTGLDHKSGHRLIEVACVELEDFMPTGRSFHRLIHPDREIDPDAERVHGISLASLKDKPRFHHPDVCDALLDFVGDSTLVAHNAPFDRGFLNSELNRAGQPLLPEPRWIDTLAAGPEAVSGHAQFARCTVQAVQDLSGRTREARGADRRHPPGRRSIWSCAAGASEASTSAVRRRSAPVRRPASGR